MMLALNITGFLENPDEQRRSWYEGIRGMPPWDQEGQGVPERGTRWFRKTKDNERTLPACTDREGFSGGIRGGSG